jgi:hypothetical protein
MFYNKYFSLMMTSEKSKHVALHDTRLVVLTVYLYTTTNNNNNNNNNSTIGCLISKLIHDCYSSNMYKNVKIPAFVLFPNAGIIQKTLRYREISSMFL